MTHLRPYVSPGVSVGLTLTAIFAIALGACGSPEGSDAIGSGQKFLLNLFEPEIGLLPEYSGAKSYWLFHDNYLAAKVLARSHPDVAKSIMAAIHREGVDKSGKIELLFGEAERPLPFHHYRLSEVRRFDSKVIRTEIVTEQILDGWEGYADLLLLACIAEKDKTTARKRWDAAMHMWDGKGFLDAAAKRDGRYSTYKLALALVAGHKFSPPTEAPQGLLDRLLAMQDRSGGWITDYDGSGRQIGIANVETTCLSILGLEAIAGWRRH